MTVSVKSNSVFVSHASADNKRSKNIDRLYKVLEMNYKVFCSSVPKSGISYGNRLFKTINDNIKNCNIFLAVITDNYLRSAYCLYEFCIARYLQKRIISIFANDAVEEKMLALQNKEVVSLVACVENESNDIDADKLVRTLSLPDRSKEELVFFLQELAMAKSEKPYIGMSKEEYKQILDYCCSEGIERFGKGAAFDKEVLAEKFSMAKRIYLLSTTGAGLLKVIKENAIPAALRNGAEINVILPDKGSAFCDDVALAECRYDCFGSVIESQNKNRIRTEFDSVFQYLNEAYSRATQEGSVNTVLGKITCYSSQTLLRQTIVLAVDENDRVWGWTTMTLPPMRTTDSPCFSVNGKYSGSSLAKLLIDHCECIMKISKDKDECCVIDGETMVNAFNCKHQDCEQYWSLKRDSAVKFMRERRTSFSRVLIEVAAQHPLYDGKVPNREFASRLDYAVKLRERLVENGIDVYLYVPGSIHSEDGIADLVSLSQAGKEYLVSQGVSPDCIYADDMNEKYKGSDGVYNSADECFVCSKIFKNHRFGRLLVVCSPYQIMRKTFFYLEQGLLPECYSVPGENFYHDVVSEYFHPLLTTVYEDHSWQGRNSRMFVMTRKERQV